MSSWIDTHCHLDAGELAADVDAVRARAAAEGVAHCVIPAVGVFNFEAVRLLAHRFSDSYGLGIHPLCVPQAHDADLAALDAELTLRRDDPRLVAVGEIGLDYFVPALTQSPMRERQEHFYREQLKLARKHGLPVILHVRRSADKLLKHLRDLAPEGGWHGIGHAFNGSEQQAGEFLKLGFKLGFGGAVSFEPALQLRRLAAELPLESLVMETDSPDIPPHWIYTTAGEREAGKAQGRNEPGELPRIAQQVAELRGISVEALAAATTANARHALPKLGALLG
ncbi:TatD family hydrolase [Polaromonas sp. YR568]|uniref:TatD family hydrolase n=1 Tax=Polaromonas sp. YR568 TaxID=1855301 RepID=UPI00398BEC34